MIQKLSRSDFMNTSLADVALGFDGPFSIIGIIFCTMLSLFVSFGGGPVLIPFIASPIAIALTVLLVANVKSPTNQASNRRPAPYYDDNGTYCAGRDSRSLLCSYYSFEDDERLLLGEGSFIDSMLTNMSGEKRSRVNWLATRAVKEIEQEREMRKQAELNSVATEDIEEILTRAYDHARIGTDTLRELT